MNDIDWDFINQCYMRGLKNHMDEEFESKVFDDEDEDEAKDKFRKQVMNSVYGSLFCPANEEKDESQCDWALVYEYTRTMGAYLDDNDKEELNACIERVKEIAIDHGGNRIDQLIHDEEGREDIESCVKVIDDANWLLIRTLDIEKREKLYSIAKEATKVLRKLVNTP